MFLIYQLTDRLDDISKLTSITQPNYDLFLFHLIERGWQFVSVDFPHQGLSYTMVLKLICELTSSYSPIYTF